MNPSYKKAIILVDHGSRLEEANEVLNEISALLREQVPAYFVQPAHMELAEPTLEQAFAYCVERGAVEIFVFPYFLAPGRHSTEDIPALCEKAALKFPQVSYRLAPPFGVHAKMVELIREHLGI